MKICHITTEGIPDFFNRPSCVFVIGDKTNLQSQLELVEYRLNAIQSNYHVRVHNAFGKTTLADYVGGQVLCPLFDISGGIRRYVVGYSEDSNDIADVVGRVVEETLKNQREYLEDIILAAAFNSPVAFNNSIDSIFGEKSSKDIGSGKTTILPFDISGIPIVPLAAFGIDAEFDLDLDAAAGFDDISSDGNLDLSETSLKSVRYLNTANISNKNKKEFLKHIPERVSERYIKKNPDCRKDLEVLIASVSHEDLQELVLELITRQKGATQIFDFSNLSAASEYELCVKKWNKSIKGFDPKFNYCIFLKDGRGKEYPVKFQHHPAYCLYLMYVIDRAIRGNDASYLSIRENKEQYLRLYQTVFGIPYDEAEKKYLTFAYRLTKEGTISRKGRYDDYLKDIDDTITSIVGRADSIPLKLRDGGHLEILPDRIKIDENLRAFNFK
ncbi:MAG: hypothetical protein HDR46_04190 [Bacteroides sp.]|nr:hypothetical protein [Bacteroides sp.]